MEETLLQRVREWTEAHKEELVNDLADLVRHKSVSRPGEGGYTMGSDCARCADRLLEIGRRYDFEVQNHEYYCVSLTMKGRSGGELGILGHMDVVPEGEGWSYPPYSATRVGDYLIGRGSGDNKGACVMSMYAMRCIRELGIPMEHDIRLIMGFNEEAGMADVEYYVEHMPLPIYTLVCDGAWPLITGEKGILTANLRTELTGGNLSQFHGGVAGNSVPDNAFARVITAARTKELTAAEGICIEDTDDGILVRATGVACHAMAPESGISAIGRLTRWLLDSELLEGDCIRGMRFVDLITSDYYGGELGIAFEDTISGKTTCIAGMADLTGSQLTLNINVRYAIEADRETQKRSLLAACSSAGFRADDLSDSGPRYMSAEEEPTAGLLKIYREMTGDMSQPLVIGGGTHARKVPNSMPFGPGHLGFHGQFGGAHSVDEAAYIPHLTDALPIYVTALQYLDQYYTAVDNS